MGTKVQYNKSVRFFTTIWTKLYVETADWLQIPFLHLASVAFIMSSRVAPMEPGIGGAGAIAPLSNKEVSASSSCLKSSGRGLGPFFTPPSSKNEKALRKSAPLYFRSFPK